MVLRRGLSPSERFQARLAVAGAAAAALHRDDIDVIVLNDAPPLLQQEVVAGGVRLLCRDPIEDVRFRVETLRAFVAARRLLKVARPYLSEQLRKPRSPWAPS